MLDIDTYQQRGGSQEVVLDAGCYQSLCTGAKSIGWEEHHHNLKFLCLRYCG